MVGKQFACANDPEHVARVVNGKAGEFWVRRENQIRRYDVQYSPWRWLGWQGHHLSLGAYVFVWYVVLLGLIFVSGRPGASLWLRGIAVLLVLWRIWDVVVVGLSTAYVRQIPAHRLRSVVFTLAGFSQVALGFSVFYVLCGNCFSPPLGRVGAVYLSVVVITTLGYAPYNVDVLHSAAWVPQLLILFNALAAVVGLSVLLPTVIQWAGAPWEHELSEDNVKDVSVGG